MTTTELQEVIEYLEETPRAVRRLSGGLSTLDLRWKPSDDEFSALEQVCHLRDIEREGYAQRIRKILEEDGPSLHDIDGSRLAAEREYNRQDFEEALAEFERARLGNLQLLGSVSTEQLSRGGVLEGTGAITLAGLLLMMRDHDESHREELSAIRNSLTLMQESE